MDTKRPKPRREANKGRSLSEANEIALRNRAELQRVVDDTTLEVCELDVYCALVRLCDRSVRV